MEVKKSQKANLENKRLLFTEIGLVLALLIVYGALNWNQREVKKASLAKEAEVVEITNASIFSHISNNLSIVDRCY